MRENFPPATKNIIIINILFFAATLVFASKGVDLDRVLGLHLFVADDFRPFQLVTYMFMHGGIMHIFFNMFAVYMFGRIIEQVWGTKRFLILYFVAGLGAALIQEIVQYIQYVQLTTMYDGVQTASGAIITTEAYVNNWVTVGASGSVYGLLLAFAMTFPNEKMFVFPLPVPIKAKYFIIGYMLIELYLGVSPNIHDTVAHFAHLGGALFALVLILVWRKQRKIHGPYL